MEQPLTSKVLYRSDNLIVRLNRVSSRGPLVVCFDPYSDDRRLDRSAWGEPFLASHGIDAAFVQSSQNDWYQAEDLPQALATLRPIADTYEQVVAYGSSMGGYAAIRHGAACGAERAVAISPQYSIDPRICPWETRWGQEATRTHFRWEDRVDGFVASALVVYDPNSLDTRHVDLFRPNVRVQDLRLPFAVIRPSGSSSKPDICRNSRWTPCLAAWTSRASSRRRARTSASRRST